MEMTDTEAKSDAKKSAPRVNPALIQSYIQDWPDEFDSIPYEDYEVFCKVCNKKVRVLKRSHIAQHRNTKSHIEAVRKFSPHVHCCLYRMRGKNFFAVYLRSLRRLQNGSLRLGSRLFTFGGGVVRRVALSSHTSYSNAVFTQCTFRCYSLILINMPLETVASGIRHLHRWDSVCSFWRLYSVPIDCCY